MYQISRDEVAFACASIPHLPQLFQDEWKKITEFSAGCDEACLIVLKSLSAEFAVHHRVDQPSDTGLKLVLHPSLAKLFDVGETLHTDSGTLTLLFYVDWSIHAFLPDANIWAFAPPLEGCALVNVADSLQRFSGGKLHSPKHRVTQPFDGAKNRYYLSYFLRPETLLVEKWNAAK
jgi:isopenicillin N synthase-like dioxygenase